MIGRVQVQVKGLNEGLNTFLFLDLIANLVPQTINVRQVALNQDTTVEKPRISFPLINSPQPTLSFLQGFFLL